MLSGVNESGLVIKGRNLYGKKSLFLLVYLYNALVTILFKTQGIIFYNIKCKLDTTRKLVRTQLNSMFLKPKSC